jgi:hypothetical protein
MRKDFAVLFFGVKLRGRLLVQLAEKVQISPEFPTKKEPFGEI